MFQVYVGGDIETDHWGSGEGSRARVSVRSLVRCMGRIVYGYS